MRISKLRIPTISADYANPGTILSDFIALSP